MPAFLLIDCGNTLTKWARADDAEKIVPVDECPTRKITPALLRQLARKFSGHRVLLSLVVPRLRPVFRSAFGKSLFVLRGDSPGLPLRFAYPRPAEIGADRIAAALAAWKDGHYPAIVVSCGTATTFTVLDRHGRFAGGMIAPGLATQLATLVGATAQLPTVALKTPRRAPAKSTADAIRAGVMLNFQGGAREIVQVLTHSLGGSPAPKIILTGGAATHLHGVLGRAAQVRPLLVFEGLRIMGERLSVAPSS